MSTIETAARMLAIAWLVMGAGCMTHAQHHITARHVVSTTSGGPREVWLVMSEVASDYDEKHILIRHEVYAVYHCVPAGCKRVSQISGLRIQRRRERDR